MGKSSGGGGGGGKGKRISGGGNANNSAIAETSQQATTQTAQTTTSRFTPEEQTGIDNTVAKLRQLPEAERQRQLARAEMTVNERIKATYNALQKLENTMKIYEERNPGISRTNHPSYNDYTKAQARYEASRKDRAKFDEVKNKIK